MNKRNPLLFPALFAFVSLLLTANPAVSQVGLHKNITPEAQQIAKEHLRSPMAKYLSGTGRNALNLMAGTLGQPATDRGLEAGPLPRLRVLAPLIVQGLEVTVNDPSQDTFFETSFDISTQSETAVAGFDNGTVSNIVVTFNDSTDFATGTSFMGYARSTDGGASFTDLGAIPATATGLNMGDPGIGVNRAGVFYASAIEFDSARPAGFGVAIGISKSTNGGQTFSAPVYPAPGGPANSFTDKPFLAVDASSGSGGGKNVYVTWTNFPAIFTGQLPIFFSRSTDGGATFSAPMQISSQGTINQGSAPVVGPDGTLYIVWEQFSQFLGQPSFIVFTKSTDGGATFIPPTQIATLNDIGFFGGTMLPGFRVNSFPRIAVSPTTGTVVITYGSNPFTGDSGDVFFIASPNGGATWNGPTQLNDDGTFNDQFFPDVAANSNGIFEFLWNDKRNDPANLSFDMFETQSLDDGASAQPNTQITSASSFPAFGYDPFVVSNYMGDYNDIEVIMTPSGPGTAFLQAWGDNRRVTVTRGGTRNDQDVMFHSD
jgi:hypothetical protein